jgi:hypothetical protein
MKPCVTKTHVIGMKPNIISLRIIECGEGVAPVEVWMSMMPVPMTF